MGYQNTYKVFFKVAGKHVRAEGQAFRPVNNLLIAGP